MTKEKHNLPSSSLTELEKIIKGYCHASKDASLDDVANLAGMHKTAVSKNNPFLAELGVVTGGKKKAITETGRKLGRAIEHNYLDDVQRHLSELVGSSEFYASLLTTVRIKGGLAREALAKHILYVSGQTATKGNKTGANTVIDLFVKGRLLSEKDGKFVVSTSASSTEDAKTVESQRDSDDTTPSYPSDDAIEVVRSIKQSGSQSPKLNISPVPSVNINIQLQVPETDNPEVYENFFRSLSKHLLGNDE